MARKSVVFVGSNGAYFGDWQMFRRNIWPASRNKPAERDRHTQSVVYFYWFRALLFDCKDGGDIFLWNVEDVCELQGTTTQKT
jgi:hypothetical protein